MQVFDDDLVFYSLSTLNHIKTLFVCVEVLQPSQPSGVMFSVVSYLLLLGRLSPLGS